MFKSISSSKRNLQDHLILFGSGLACLFLLPFSIYRFLIGDYAIAAVDLMIGAGLVAIFVQSWRSKKISYLNTAALVCFMMGVVWVMNLRGMSMIFWAFPTIGFAYFVLESRKALSLNFLFIAVVTFIFFETITKSQALSIYPSLILACLFGYAFSACSEEQNKKLLTFATEDTLTEVKNRRSFDNKVGEIVEQNKRIPSSVCLLLLDLDFFKKVNDNYGHKQGDQVLIEFAQRVRLMIRNSDYIYRIGGEEFAIIASNLELKKAFKFADTIRDTIQATPSLLKYNVTVSIGISEIKKADDADSWFKRADLALYEAKAEGRNRVCLAEQNVSGEITFIQKKSTKIVKLAKQFPDDLKYLDQQSTDSNRLNIHLKSQEIPNKILS